MKKLILAFALLLTGQVFAQGQAYRIYTSDGSEVSFEKMIRGMEKSDIVLLGELHNNPIAHWMQLLVVETLDSNGHNLALGAEMYERDDQLIIDEYLGGVIREKNLEQEAKLWPNDETDYRPVLNYCKDNGIPFYATNVPRRYASLVAYQGLSALDDLSEEAQSYLAPLPFPFDSAAPGYPEMLQMGHGHMSMTMVHAQALKDATMADAIRNNMPKKGIFVHMQGDYHSANGGGINWYLSEYAPRLKRVTLSTVESANCEWSDDFANRGDYILVVDDRMTKTY